MITKTRTCGIIKKIACLFLALSVTVSSLWVAQKETRASDLGLVFGSLNLGQVALGMFGSVGVTFAVADLMSQPVTLNDLVANNILVPVGNGATFDKTAWFDTYASSTNPQTTIFTQLINQGLSDIGDMLFNIGNQGYVSLSDAELFSEYIGTYLNTYADNKLVFPSVDFVDLGAWVGTHTYTGEYYSGATEYLVTNGAFVDLTGADKYYKVALPTSYSYRYRTKRSNGVWNSWREFGSGTINHYAYFSPAEEYGASPGHPYDFAFSVNSEAELKGIIDRLNAAATSFDNVYTNVEGLPYNKDDTVSPIIDNDHVYQIPSTGAYGGFINTINNPSDRPTAVIDFVDGNVIPFPVVTEVPEPTTAPEPTQVPEPTSPAIVPPVPDKPTLPDKPNWNPSTDPGTEGNPNPVIDPDRLPEGLPEAGPAKDPNTDVTLEEGDSSNLNDYKLDANWQSVFPFCIPFDLYKMYQMINAPRQAPYFKGDFKYGSNTQEVIIDLSPFDPVATVMRKLELIAFIIALAVGTRKLIGALG